jgi:DNA-binding PadR family transcriptional regulator
MTKRLSVSRGRPRRPAAVVRALTVPDLVVLGLLAERPMYGYEVVAELDRRQSGDWANVSRPQVYYSLDKLVRLGLLRPATDAEPAAGPERRVLTTTATGRARLGDALERDDWTTGRDRPAFLTWMALSWLARPGVFEAHLRRRRAFLGQEIAREEETRRAVDAEVGHPYHEAVWMLTLMIDQLKIEARWIERVLREAGRRAPAKRPAAQVGRRQALRRGT